MKDRKEPLSLSIEHPNQLPKDHFYRRHFTKNRSIRLTSRVYSAPGETTRALWRHPDALPDDRYCRSRPSRIDIGRSAFRYNDAMAKHPEDRITFFMEDLPMDPQEAFHVGTYFAT